MIENINGRKIECRSCHDGYSIEVSGNQVWWVDYDEKNPEMKAEIAFSSIVSALQSIYDTTQRNG